MPKRILQGTVVSNAGDKTVVVRVDRSITHPVYGKTIRRSDKFHAHDENNTYQQGDVVRIQECAPHSKLKRWEVISGAEQTA